MAKIGRPKKKIDKKIFENLCGLQCTQEEMCGVFECDDVTLNSWCKETYQAGFSDVFKQKRGVGKTSLRRKQWKLADTNAAMAIFLGKNLLEQSDKCESDLDKQILEQQLKKLEKETELLKTKIDQATKGGSAQEILEGLAKLMGLSNTPIENRNIEDFLPESSEE